MVSMSMLGVRAGIPAMLISVTYAHGLIRLLNSTKTRPIAAMDRTCSDNVTCKHACVRHQSDPGSDAMHAMRC